MLTSDVRSCAARAATSVLRLRSLLQDQNAKEVLPPFPVLLTLVNIEEWLVQAEEAAKKPRLAKAKKLLAEIGIDATNIPADVLDKPDELSELASHLAGLPKTLREKATTALGAALTKGMPDAREILGRFAKAGQALGSLDKLSETRPWLHAVAVKEVADNPTAAAQIVKRATDADSLLAEPDRLGLRAPDEEASLERLESVLRQFGTALVALNAGLVKEGLGKGEIPPLQGKSLSEAQVVFQEALGKVEQEKQRLVAQYEGLTERLAEFGIPVDLVERKVAALRKAIQELTSVLNARLQELQRSLGENTLGVLEQLTKGKLPGRAQVADEELGAAVRKLADAGYRVRLEIDHEDKRQ